MHFTSRVVVSTALACAVVPVACFSPNVTPDGGDTEGGSSSTGTADTTTTSMTTTSPSTSSNATTESPTTEGDSTTSDATSTSDPTNAETTTTSGPPDPFCGDGNIDDDEECDDGDANANTAACRADCTMAACGDGNVWEGVEACDDGMAANELEVGACAPDCSRVIEEREIVTGEWITGDGDLGGNPVGVADGTCPVGYAAMFVVNGVRRASATPYAGDDQLDWVLSPYTAYVRSDGELVWITDAVALLGVRNGAPQPLLAPVHDINPLLTATISGLNANWTTAVSNNCSGWSSANANVRYGASESTTEYLYIDTKDCDEWSVFAGGFFFDTTNVYCVEQ